MKNETILQHIIHDKHKREIFVTGFYYSFIFIMLLAMFLDYITNNITDASIELFFSLLTLIALFYYKKSGKTDFAVYMIVVLVTLSSYALLISNDFNLSIFHIIVPLGYFILFSLFKSVLYYFMHQGIVAMLYIYGFTQNPIDPAYEISNLIAIAIATLIILLFGIFYHLAVENTYRQMEHLNRQLQKSNREKEILLDETHHRIKNNLHMIATILGLQQEKESDGKVKEVLEKNRLRIYSIAMVHDILHGDQQVEKIPFHKYMTDLTDMIIATSAKNIQSDISQSAVILDAAIMLKLGIITNELLTNTIKHARPQGDLLVHIALHELEDHYLYRYRDNGRNAVEIETKDSLGFKIIHALTEQLHGKLSLDTAAGLRLQIQLPLLQPA